MKVVEWLKGAKQKTETLDAELIALRAFAPKGADRSWLVAHGDSVATEAEIEVADEMLARRVEGEPLAYVLREKEFYGRKFTVTTGVLVPRPETEVLIELVKGLDLPTRPQFLEVGTGSGCIAVTLALEFSQAFVVATDLSEEALVTAQANDDAYEGRIEFYQGDLLGDFPEDIVGFDVLVANLPYVDRSWEWLDKRTLGYEPEEALYAGDGGLALYKKLILQIWRRGADFTKYVVFETDPCQHEDLIKFAEEYGFSLLKAEGFGLAFRVA